MEWEFTPYAIPLILTAVISTAVAIVAMTAHAMQEDRERALAAGMDDYITKPLRADDLLAAIRRLVGP
jgi:two-component system sensor histidine kinase/response regulator